MNELFVCIKVDREERPDVDQIYMDTVTRPHRPRRLAAHRVLRARRPARSTAAPTSRPSRATACPRSARCSPAVGAGLARAAATRSTQQRRRDHRGARAAARAASRARRPAPHGGRAGARCACSSAPTPSTAASAARPSSRRPTILDLLLAAGDVLPERKAREALDHVVLTCREMARGGLYDQLGGGFHRYSVDARWCVPHFEKMLYDQGQLLRIYAEAWRRSGASDDDLALAGARDRGVPAPRDARARRRLLREPGRRQRGRGGHASTSGRPTQVARGARRRARRRVLRAPTR